jgi:hypothetical protein
MQLKDLIGQRYEYRLSIIQANINPIWLGMMWVMSIVLLSVTVLRFGHSSRIWIAGSIPLLFMIVFSYVRNFGLVHKTSWIQFSNIGITYFDHHTGYEGMLPYIGTKATSGLAGIVVLLHLSGHFVLVPSKIFSQKELRDVLHNIASKPKEI